MKTHRFTLQLASLLVMGFCLFSCCPPRALVGGGGCGFTNFSGDDTESWDTGSRLDLFVGLPFGCDQTAPISLTPILSLQKRGADFEQSDGSYSFSEKFRMSYIYVEQEASAFIAADKLEVVFAPQLGFLIDATSDVESNPGGNYKEDVSDYYKSVDFGLRGGLRYNITDRLAAGVHYYRGLTNVSEDFNTKHNAFHLRVQYRIKDL